MGVNATTRRPRVPVWVIPVAPRPLFCLERSSFDAFAHILPARDPFFARLTMDGGLGWSAASRFASSAVRPQVAREAAELSRATLKCKSHIVTLLAADGGEWKPYRRLGRSI